MDWEQRVTVTGKHALAADEVDALLGAEDRLERRALLATAVGTGIRRGDIVALELPNLELFGSGPEAVRVRFWEEKKDRRWEAWVPPELAQPLRSWLRVHDQRSRFVWPSNRSASGHISSRTAYNWLQDALERAGLESRPFHALRSTCIKLLKRAGWSDEQIMEQTGDRLETIQMHYLTPTEREMREAAISTRFDGDGDGGEYG